jgi:hypothetical protein
MHSTSRNHEINVLTSDRLAGVRRKARIANKKSPSFLGPSALYIGPLVRCKKFVNSFAKRCVRTADHGQGGQTIGQMDFDGNGGRFYTHLGAAVHDGEGHGRSLR